MKWAAPTRLRALIAQLGRRAGTSVNIRHYAVLPDFFPPLCLARKRAESSAAGCRIEPWRRKPAPCVMAGNKACRGEPMGLFDLGGKTAVDTGSSRGIGRAIAEAMAEGGAKVVISSRKPEACEAVAASIREAGGQATAIACHVGDKVQLKRWSTKPIKPSAASTSSSTMSAPIRRSDPFRISPTKPSTASWRAT